MFNTARGAAFLSLLTNVFLVGLKLGIGLAIGSIAVLSDALDSGMDLVGSFIALFAIRLAAQPADRSHPYGHGKFESLSAIAEGALILVAPAFIIYEAINRLEAGTDIGGVGLGIVAMSISLLINGGISLHLRRVARETGSVALQATAWHRTTDIFTSLGVLVGLIIIQLTPWEFLDAVIALAVAAFVVSVAFRLIARAFRNLLDEGLPEEELAIIRQVLEGHRDEFIEYHGIRSRRSGSLKQMGFHLVMPRNITVGEAHQVTDGIEADIEARLPRSITTIHVEPCEVPQELCDAECGPVGRPPSAGSRIPPTGKGGRRTGRPGTAPARPPRWSARVEEPFRVTSLVRAGAVMFTRRRSVSSSPVRCVPGSGTPWSEPG